MNLIIITILGLLAAISAINSIKDFKKNWDDIHAKHTAGGKIKFRWFLPTILFIAFFTAIYVVANMPEAHLLDPSPPFRDATSVNSPIPTPSTVIEQPTNTPNPNIQTPPPTPVPTVTPSPIESAPPDTPAPVYNVKFILDQPDTLKVTIYNSIGESVVSYKEFTNQTTALLPCGLYTYHIYPVYADENSTITIFKDDFSVQSDIKLDIITNNNVYPDIIIQSAAGEDLSGYQVEYALYGDNLWYGISPNILDSGCLGIDMYPFQRGDYKIKLIDSDGSIVGKGTVSLDSSIQHKVFIYPPDTELW